MCLVDLMDGVGAIVKAVQVTGVIQGTARIIQSHALINGRVEDTIVLVPLKVAFDTVSFTS